MKVELEEGDRQAIILALAKLSLSRPGWHAACLSRIAEQLSGLQMYEQFRAHGPEQAPDGGPMIEAAAAAIANTRGGRRGAPAVANILEILPEKLRTEVIEDAKAAITAAIQV